MLRHQFWLDGTIRCIRVSKMVGSTPFIHLVGIIKLKREGNGWITKPSGYTNYALYFNKKKKKNKFLTG